MTILDKILSLRNYFSQNKAEAQDIVVIEGWYEKAKRLLLVKSLLDHDGIKYVKDIFEGEVKMINSSLLESDSSKLPDYNRDRLLDRRDLAQKYLDLFNGVDEELDSLEEQVDKESV